MAGCPHSRHQQHLWDVINFMLCDRRGYRRRFHLKLAVGDFVLGRGLSNEVGGLGQLQPVGTAD